MKAEKLTFRAKISLKPVHCFDGAIMGDHENVDIYSCWYRQAIGSNQTGYTGNVSLEPSAKVLAFIRSFESYASDELSNL